MELSFRADGVFGIVMDIILLAVGFALIIKGGDVFVESSVRIARKLGVPELIVGATIVSVGTTLPEIITSVTSVVKGMAAGSPALEQGYNSLAVGNAVGSVMCNAGLILGLVLLIKPPSTGGGFAVKGIFLLTSLAVLALFAGTGGMISVAEGMALLALFVAFTGINMYGAAKAMNLREPVKVVGEKTGVKDGLRFAAGAAAIALGAMLLVDNAQSLCLGAGISQQIIGVTVVAVGTSLPELVTSLTSLKKGAAAVGVGNVIGANVINATLLVGTLSCLSGRGLGIDDVTADVAVWVALAICAALVLPSAVTKKTYRWQGALMLALYLGFIVYNTVVVVL